MVIKVPSKRTVESRLNKLRLSEGARRIIIAHITKHSGEQKTPSGVVLMMLLAIDDYVVFLQGQGDPQAAYAGIVMQKQLTTLVRALFPNSPVNGPRLEEALSRHRQRVEKLQR